MIIYNASEPVKLCESDYVKRELYKATLFCIFLPCTTVKIKP